MICKKCHKEIPEDSVFCNFCGKKQETKKIRYHKRANGMGTITKDKRYKKPYIAHAPSTRFGSGRVYIGAYETMREAQEAIEKYVREGRPELYNATLGDIYQKWADIHFKQVSDKAVSLYSCMWKRFSDIADMKMRDVRTAHFQDIVNKATSKSACDTLKTMSVMICKFAMENDIINKNYAEFIKIPKFDKKEKKIFTKEEISRLWELSDDERIQLILFMIYTGFRIGEISSLKVSEIHFDEGYIIGGEKTKAGRNRIVPIPQNIPEITAFLKNWIAKADGEYLFSKTTNRLRTDFYVALIVYGFAKGTRKGDTFKFSTPHHTPHSTRHTFATLAADSGVSPESLQKIIGHSNYSTTANIYLHKNVDSLCTEMRKIVK